MSEIQVKEFVVHPVEKLQEELDRIIKEIGKEIGAGDHIVATQVVSVQLRESFPADSNVQGTNMIEKWVVFYRTRAWMKSLEQ